MNRIALATATATALWAGCTADTATEPGSVTGKPDDMQDAGADRIDGAALKELVPDIAGREVYVSGSPASVRSLRTAARRAGAGRIHVDSFSGY